MKTLSFNFTFLESMIKENFSESGDICSFDRDIIVG